MNSITILGYTIPDSQIMSGNIILTNSMICDELSADEAFFEVNYFGPAPVEGLLYASGGEQLFTKYGEALTYLEEQNAALVLDSIPYGTPIVYSHNDKVIGKFYTTGIQRTGKYRWEITAQSAIGLLIRQEHNGGVYSVANGDTIGSLIDEIMAGLSITYTVSQSLINQYVAGWLPVASCRDNLKQVCFAFGISVMKDSNGDLLFEFNEPEEPEATLIESNIFIGGKKNYITPISRATVYEHAYYAVVSRTPVIVFDNTGETQADNLKIIFDNPVIESTLTPTGTLVISESNANYAIVSGLGTIEGVEYTHTIKVLTEDTGVTTAEDKEKVYRDMTLVNALNSENCLKRVASYYSQASEIVYDIVAESERPGEMVQYPDPFEEESKAGLIKRMDINVSGILKSNTLLTEGWLPNHLGNNFSEVEIFTEDGSYTIPEGVEVVRIVMIQGGQGAQGGEAGHASMLDIPWYDPQIEHMEGGVHGTAGVKGSAGKVYAINIPVTEGDVLAVHIGAGGLGTAAVAAGQTAALGAEGGETTITINGETVYSSASGSIPVYPYAELLSGNLYAFTGEDGVDGADGGSLYGAQPGSNVIYKGTTYYGGAGRYSEDHGSYTYANIGGSGAAVGEDGVQAPSYNAAAKGADANDGADATIPGSGGEGGHGGGGGGSGVMRRYRNDPSDPKYWSVIAQSVGGNAGKGGDGADGIAFIYH